MKLLQIIRKELKQDIDLSLVLNSQYIEIPIELKMKYLIPKTNTNQYNIKK